MPNDELRRLINKRKSLELDMQELVATHPQVFEQIDNIKESIAQSEVEIKDLVRAKYQEGHERGIFMQHDDELLCVKVTVKYQKDCVDYDDFKEYVEENKVSAKVVKELHKVVNEVSAERIKQLVDDDILDESALDLIKPGKFQTPAVTIKNKLTTEAGQ